MKKFFLLITFLSINLIQTRCVQGQSSVSAHEVSKIVEHSKVFIEEAKKGGLSDSEIIEKLDTVLAEAALADNGEIQGKSRNLQRLLWIAGGAATGLAAGAIIWAIVHHYYNQAARNLPEDEELSGSSHLEGSQDPLENEELEPLLENFEIPVDNNNENVEQHHVGRPRVEELHVVRNRVHAQEQRGVRRSTRKRRPPSRFDS